MNLIDCIQVGDRITILTPYDQNRSGRVVTFGRNRQHAVLNMGGRYGTPGFADENNIVQIKRNKKVIYGQKTI